MTTDFYFLFGHEIVPCDAFTWGMWHGMSNCVISRDEVGEVIVSTIFLGLNRESDPDSPPLVFETMVFGGSYGDYQERYTTYTQAEAGHRRIVEMISEDDDSVLVAEFIWA